MKSKFEWTLKFLKYTVDKLGFAFLLYVYDINILTIPFATKKWKLTPQDVGQELHITRKQKQKPNIDKISTRKNFSSQYYNKNQRIENTLENKNIYHKHYNWKWKKINK